MPITELDQVLAALLREGTDHVAELQCGRRAEHLVVPVAAAGRNSIVQN